MEIENKHCKKRYSNTWNDQIDSVEQSLSSHGEDEGDVCQKLLLIIIILSPMFIFIHLWIKRLNIFCSRNIQYIPLNTEVKFRQVNTKLNNIVAWFLMHVLQINLLGIISPTSKLHITILFIKWKPFNIYFTGGFVNCWRCPLYITSVFQLCFGH